MLEDADTSRAEEAESGTLTLRALRGDVACVFLAVIELRYKLLLDADAARADGAPAALVEFLGEPNLQLAFTA